MRHYQKLNLLNKTIQFRIKTLFFHKLNHVFFLINVCMSGELSYINSIDDRFDLRGFNEIDHHRSCELFEVFLACQTLHLEYSVLCN